MALENILYILFAILGLGLLIFIHELGHYLMAKLCKMKIEVFSIGFGNPILQWKFQKTTWQIGWIPFGGYVKIAGMQIEKGKDPYGVKDGFFGKKPYQRILVALMGPLFNFLFALLAFAMLWVLGGKNYPFSQYTKRIGWVDPNSHLYQKGLRTGDEITFYNQKPYHNFQDLLMTAGKKNAKVSFDGFFVDPYTQNKIPFHLNTKTYEWKEAALNGIFTPGITLPAQQLIYSSEKIAKDANLQKAGMQKGDRVVWTNGEFIYSFEQLDHLINESSVLVTVERNGQFLTLKLPKILISELKLSASTRDEIDDWRHEAKLPQAHFQELYFLPFSFNDSLRFESPIKLIDTQKEKNLLVPMTQNSLLTVPKRGDRIVKIDLQTVHSPEEVLSLLQKRNVLMVVEREFNGKTFSAKNPDEAFENPSQGEMINALLSKGFSLQEEMVQKKNFVLLKPLEPKLIKDFKLTDQQIKVFEKVKKENSSLFENHYFLDIPYGFQDAKIHDNPNPLLQTKNMLSQMGNMISSLFQGKVKFQWLSGPVGIVHLMQKSWQSGGKEVLSWMAFISLNLGVINLFPLPALDGGHIVFALIEMVRRKPVSIRLMEKITFVFLILLFAGIIYLTYQDILRMIRHLF